MAPGVPPESDEAAGVGCALMLVVFLLAAFGGPVWLLLTGQA